MRIREVQKHTDPTWFMDLYSYTQRYWRGKKAVLTLEIFSDELWESNAVQRLRTGEQLFPGRECWADAPALGQERRTGGPGQQVPGKNYQLIQTHVTVQAKSKEVYDTNTDENTLSKLYFCSRIRLKESLPIWVTTEQCWKSLLSFLTFRSCLFCRIGSSRKGISFKFLS
jgi:hypothetical protein